MTDPTLRFSSRVTNYVKYRPGYPSGVIATLQEECGLAPDSVIADIGSGTGILTKLFLENGNRVFAVEPNREMRKAGERLLRIYPGFHSVDGRAEATTLPGRSVEFVAAGQAFHWFDRTQCRSEFSRILKPQGCVVLVWNERELEATPFLIAYEQLLQRHSIDYDQVNHTHVNEAVLADFFRSDAFKLREFRNRQELDYPALEGRLLSSSYVPEAGHPNHEPMLAELSRIFHAHQRRGHVEFEYATKMYYGRIH